MSRRFLRLTIMQPDLKAFWERFPSGIEVAVASAASDKLLGIREGFLRYFHHGVGRPVPVAVVPHRETEELSGLCFSDEDTVEMARGRALKLREELGDTYHFYVGSEGGLHSLEIDGTAHYFVRSWTVVLGPAGEGWGASGSVEVPGRFISGLDDQQIPFAIPGTRRRGGMISSLTVGLETRRSAVAEATFHALATVFYGILGSRTPRRR